MGQPVVIKNSVALGDVLLVDTDRSLTGQDGQTITPEEPGHSVPGQVAESLFGLELGIDHLHVLQNTISIRRESGWDDESVARVNRAIEDFLKFYD